MYEDYLGLSKRPFSSVPNADCFVPVLPAQEALDSLIHCVTQSRGIGVITSAPGLGKSQLCKQLAVNLTQEFRTVYLSTSSFHTRRALLQSILYELGINYVGLSEQEARLRIFEAARASQTEGRFLLIIADEAHLLNNRLFEELRALADYAPDGVSLIRLILSGEFELEEKLTDPAMTAFNQRVGTQVCLDPLSLEQSAQFIMQRLNWAGAKNIDSILTEEALEAICRASDGNPRCLCQLADHCCLLSYAEEQKPITRGIVLAALNDVKELPLTWSEVGESPESSTSMHHQEQTDDDDLDLFLDLDGGGDTVDGVSRNDNSMLDASLHDTKEFEIPNLNLSVEAQAVETEANMTHEQRISQPTSASNVTFAVLEVGGESSSLNAAIENTDAMPSQQILSMNQSAIHADHKTVLSNMVQDLSVEQLIEKAVHDRYAFLDRMAQLPPYLRDEVSLEVPIEGDVRVRMSPTGEIYLNSEEDDCALESDLLETIESIRTEIINPLHKNNTDWDDEHVQLNDEIDWIEYDVVQPATNAFEYHEATFSFEPRNDRNEISEHLDSQTDSIGLLQEVESESEHDLLESEEEQEELVLLHCELEISDLEKCGQENCELVTYAPETSDSQAAFVVEENIVQAVEPAADSLSMHACCVSERCELETLAGETNCCGMEVCEVEVDKAVEAPAEVMTVVEQETLSTELESQQADNTNERTQGRRFEQLFTRLRLRRRKVQDRAAG